MSRTTTDKLFVNLSASQTRKRLKGRGLGVRRVESSGRNQSVIVHTATGDHRDHLQSLFADVATSSCETELEAPLENLRNLGPSSASWLRDVGIATVKELADVGPTIAFKLVQRQRPDVSLNLLWALAAGLQERDCRDLNVAEKERLKKDLEADE